MKKKIPNVRIIMMATCLSLAHCRPIPSLCADSDMTDILGHVISASNRLPIGVEIISEKNGNGYRFLPEARLLNVKSQELLTKCLIFPEEFSFVVTFKPPSTRNENQYFTSLLAPDDRTILFALKLQRDAVVMDYTSSSGRQSVAFRDDRILDGEFHTAIISVTRNQAKFSLDCSNEQITLLKSPFPAKMDTTSSRFYIASRKMKKNRFKGILQQLKFLPGSDASTHLCVPATSFYPAWLEATMATMEKRKRSDLQIVHFEEEMEGDMTCDENNKGKLMYRHNGEGLDMCQGQRWKRLAIAKRELNYIEEYADLITKSKTLDLEIFEIPGEGIFLAAANQGRDKDMSSSVYRWEEKRFVSYQNITTDSAQDWEYFTISDEHFLVVANQGANEREPSALSVMYRWDGAQKKFVSHQYFRTFAAQCWKSFSIKDKHYLVVANYGGEILDNGASNLREKSWVFLWEDDNRSFVPYQSLDSIGGVDFEFFQIDGESYLAAANSFNGDDSRVDSIIYKWTESKFIPLQYIETIGAHDLEYFTIDSRHFLAIANYYDYRGKSYAMSSVIYEMSHNRNRFVKLQEIKTMGALDIEIFTVGEDHFLIAASSADDKDKLSSYIYKWKGIENFVPIHELKSRPCADWETFQLANGEQYLVSANVKGRHSKILHLKTR